MALVSCQIRHYKEYSSTMYGGVTPSQIVTQSRVTKGHQEFCLFVFFNAGKWRKVLMMNTLSSQYKKRV
jgi:hypothetical protein